MWNISEKVTQRCSVKEKLKISKKLQARFSGPYFPAFGLNIRTRKTPNMDTFQAEFHYLVSLLDH